jgi:hypothetical protein
MQPSNQRPDISANYVVALILIKGQCMQVIVRFPSPTISLFYAL